MQVPALGDAAAWVRGHQNVPFEHGDPVEAFREHAGREQPGDTGAEDNRVATFAAGRGGRGGPSPGQIISVGPASLARLPDRPAVCHHASVAVMCSRRYLGALASILLSFFYTAPRLSDAPIDLFVATITGRNATRPGGSS